MSDRTTPSDEENGEDALDDPRVFEAVQLYLRDVEQGKRVNRREFVAQYPAIEGQLSDCLDALAFVNSVAGQIADPSGSRASKRPRREAIDPSTAQPLGDFKLLREIGHGGMGTVYEATQLSLGRRVAVKVLPMAAALDERHLERFHNEAQAAARLHHTNIVPVFAVGCERSVHFYAMQLIDGQSLAEVIKELKTLAKPLGAMVHSSMPATQLDTTLTSLKAARSAGYFRSVVKLGLQVAEALAYAHDAGVVHRDIKPANLLLDGQGKLWVTDFGLAQLNVDTGLTRSGDLVGTLRYMSPEQASGRAVVLDERTDIYSLGVTIFELLTLQRAIPGQTHEQLLYQITHQQPKQLRSIDKAIPKELETIVHKAMSKEASDRYSSADALAEDLRRFLEDKPILARPPTMIDRGLRWTRKHKALAASVFSVLALAAIGFSISTLLIATEQSRTANALQAEKQKAIEADQQRQRAERADRMARQAVDFFSHIATDEMDKPGYSDIRRQMLDESLSYYQSFLQDAGESASASSELTAARAKVTAFLQRYTSLDALLRESEKVRLLNNPDVRRDLGLSRPEVAPATDLADTAPMSIHANQQTALAEQVKQLDNAIVQLKEATLKAIGADNVARLNQIYLQTLGPLALSDPDVVRQLDLSSAQQSRIRSMLSQYRTARFEPRMPPMDRGGPPPEDFFGPDPHGERQGPGMPNDRMRPPDDDRFDSLRGETLKQMLDLLTAAQRQQWETLFGKAFPVQMLRGMPDDDSPHGNSPPGPPMPSDN